MRRFFFPNNPLDGPVIRLTDPKEIHHLKDVLRFKKEDQIRIFNDQGKEIVGTILKVSKNLLELRVDYTQLEKKKKNFYLSLACAIPKKAKFEFILEKCTELGVDEFFPLLTARTESKLPTERSEKKVRRYEQVVINACKQSGRTDIPVIHSITAFPGLFKTITPETAKLIACLTGERKNLADVLKEKQLQPILLIIGPEGDFTDEEVKLALKLGAIPISLGTNVLKVDTAAISACSFTAIFLDHDQNH